MMEREEKSTTCRDIWISTRPRSVSPSKRLKPNDSHPQEVGDWDGEDASDWEEQQRGRKRRRRSSTFGIPGSHSTDSRDLLYSGSEMSYSANGRLLHNLRTEADVTG
jgi:hypothetical protein